MRSRFYTSIPLFTLLLAVACGQQEAGNTAQPPTAQAPTATASASGDVPYSVGLAAFEIEGYPGLHSFALAGTADKTVLLAGRTNGLHGFAPSRVDAEFPSFPEEFANDTVYVLDLTAKTLLGAARVDALPDPYPQQLKASNTQYLLQNGYLLVVGGYGESPKTGTLVTLPYITAIEFDPLVAVVTSGGALDAAFAEAHMASYQHPALAITGGDVRTLGDLFLLIYGQRFDGEYTPGGGQAFQEYSNSVRVFSVSAGETEGKVDLHVDYKGSDPEIVSGVDPDGPYHRRDLSVKPALAPDGSERIGVYGGVFKGGRMEGYEHPIYITADSNGKVGIAVNQDDSASQLLSQYDCPVLQLHSASSSTMYSTFYGGMSYYYWDAAGKCLKHDTLDLNAGVDGLPFIDSVSTFRVTGTATRQFLHTGASFPPASSRPQCVDPESGAPVSAALLGSETKFVPVSGLPQSDGVIHLDQITEPTVIGYLIGGIASTNPYGSTHGTTCASNQVYEVTLDPTAATATVEPQLCS